MPDGLPTESTRLIASRVRKLREAHGWTQTDLAKQMQAQGVNWIRIVVGNLEGGRRVSVTVDELIGLAAIFGVPPLALLEPPTCDQCLDSPPPGFICTMCKAAGGLE